jgi:adenylate cyclase
MALSMTLRQKIVSLTFGVLVIFAGTVGTSLLLQRAITERFASVIEGNVPLQAAVATIDVFTDRYELELLRLLVDKPALGAGFGARLLEVEASRARMAELLTSTFGEIDRKLSDVIQDPDVAVDERVAMADIRGRFSYMDRALPDFIEVGRRYIEAVKAGRDDDVLRSGAAFTRYRALFGPDLTAVRDQLAALTEHAVGRAADLHAELILLEGAMLVLASLLGLGISLMISSRMMAGMERLIAGTQRMQEGEVYEPLPVTSRDEIGTLTTNFNRMAAELKAKDRIREMFGKYVDPRIIANLLDPQGEAGMAERQVATVFFSDIKGFTSLSELLTASTMVKFLNTYFTEMSAVVHGSNGIIDKYIGDAVMAFWTQPFSPGDSHAADACLAALAQQAAIAKLRENLSDVLGLRRNLPKIEVRMGLATGDLVVGTIGSPTARSFTVIGDTVNLASRLEGTNKAYGTSILVSEQTFRLAQQVVEAREIDMILVVGKIEPVRIYEILAAAGALTPAQTALCEAFAAGLAAYRGRDWDGAEAAFARCLAAVPDDGPAAVFRDRIAVLRRESPPADWDGAWRLTTK